VSSISGTKTGLKIEAAPDRCLSFLKDLENIRKAKYIFFFSFPETGSGQG
jgi:hypothetical protein